MDTALQAHQSLRKDFTSVGDSSGPLNPFSLPLQRFPQGHICALLAQVPAGHEDTRGEAPRVVQETGWQRADLAGGLALSLSRGPGGGSSSPPPKLQRAKARGCLQGSREAEAPPCPSVLPVPQPWPLPICLALPGMATSGRHQGKHSQADPHLPAAQNKASVPRPNHMNTSHTEICTTWPPDPCTWKVTHRLHQQHVRQKHSAGSLLTHTCAPHTCACTHTHTHMALPLSLCSTWALQVCPHLPSKQESPLVSPSFHQEGAGERIKKPGNNSAHSLLGCAPLLRPVVIDTGRFCPQQDTATPRDLSGHHT